MRKNRWLYWGALIVFGTTVACIPGKRHDPPTAKEALPAAKKALQTAKKTPLSTTPSDPNKLLEFGLKLTKDGIEFSDAYCIGAYNSQVSNVVTNAEGRRVAYKISSTCTSNGNVYIWEYSNITYNLLGQQTGYNLKISSSKDRKEYDIICSNILRDNIWEIISYDVKIGDDLYKFKRK